MKQCVPLIVLLLAGTLSAAEYGIAWQYVQDQGIDKDSNVIFTENFEEATLAQSVARWEDISHQERMVLSPDISPQSGGKHSMLFNGSAHLYRRILPGYETVYARFYAKFDTGCQNVHHWVWLGGHNPSTSWPWPRAGEKPVGDERWSTGIEPMGSGWAWDFYTYWMHMRTNPDTRFWGNTFNGRPSPYKVPKGEWLCVEFMVKMNSPVTSYNGEQAFWINGEKLSHLGLGFPKGKWVWDGYYPDSTGQPFEGFQWRSVPELLINYFWLEHYVDTDAGCTCWFDDVVVAKRYIGPMKSTAAAHHDRTNGYGAKNNRPGFPNPINATQIRRLLQEDPTLGLYDVRGNRVADRTAINNGVYIIRNRCGTAIREIVATK
jgi:hypothetical protein